MSGGVIPWFIVACLAGHLAEQQIKHGGRYSIALWGMLSGFAFATSLFVGLLKGLAR